MAITISGENNNDRILASDGVIDQLSGFSIVGVVTATSFTGDLTGNVTGNLTGNVNSTSPLLLQTGGSERFRITGNNELGIAGANYGSAGQVLTSGGSGNAVTWSAIPSQVSIANNADNRLITGGSGTNLNGESTITYDNPTLEINTDTSPYGTLTLNGNTGGLIQFEDNETTKWQIFGATDINIYDSANSTSRFYIANTGKVGINQSTPTAELEVKPTGTNTTSTIFIHAPQHNTNVASEAILKFGYGHSGSPDAVGHIKMIEDATNSFDGDFVFNLPTNNQSGGSATNERLRLDSHGRLIVGGGTHAGGSALVVKGGNQNTYSTIGMFSNHTNPSGDTLLSQMRFGANGTAVGADIRVYADADWGTNDYPSRISLYTTPDGSNSRQERIRIQSDGKILIAKGTPNTTTSQVQIGNYTTGYSWDNGDIPQVLIAGINNESPTSGTLNIALRVADENNNNLFQIYNRGGGNTDVGEVFVAGKLLLNTNTNRNKYFNGTYTGQLQVEGTNDSTRLTQFIHNSNATASHILVIGKSRGTSTGSYTAVQDGDFLGTLSFQGADGDEMVDGARIEARVNGTPGNDDMHADMIFRTNHGTASPRERLRITAKGKLLQRQDSYSETYQPTSWGNAFYLRGGWMRFTSNFSNPTKDLVILPDGGNANSNMFIKVTVCQLDYPGGQRGLGAIHIGYASAKRYGDSTGKWYVDVDSTMTMESGSNFHGNFANVGSLSFENSNPSDTNTLRYTANRVTNYDTYNVQVEVWESGNCSYYLHDDFVT